MAKLGFEKWGLSRSLKTKRNLELHSLFVDPIFAAIGGDRAANTIISSAHEAEDKTDPEHTFSMETLFFEVFFTLNTRKSIIKKLFFFLCSHDELFR